MRRMLLSLLFASATQAFYIWTSPGAACPDLLGCPEFTKRSPSDGSVAFELHQRLSNSNEDAVQRASRQAERLLRKFAVREKGLDRRENRYPMQPAVPPTAANSLGIDQDGTDFSYFITVGVGSSQKPMHMLLDTGAGTTWVMASSCQSMACTLHNTFGPDDSKTYVASDKTFEIVYGTGTVGGSLVQDTMVMSHFQPSFTFGVANTTSSDFGHFPFDGILGLSLSAASTDNFLRVLQQGKMLDSNVFSMALNRNADGTNTGQITFGAIDASKEAGPITYTPVEASAAGDWALALGEIAYYGHPGIRGRTSYIDSGTSYAFGPLADVSALHKTIPGSVSQDGGITYSVPCTSDPLTVTFSGVTYNISARDWITRTGTGGCTSNVFGHEVVPGAWLLGDIFMKNVYTVFDVDHSRIGFAPMSPPVPAPAPPPAPGVPTSTTTLPWTASPTSAQSTPAVGPPTVIGTSATPPALPGLSGHEPSRPGTPAGTAAGGSSGPPAQPTGLLPASSGVQLGAGNTCLMGIVVAVIAVVV